MFRKTTSDNSLQIYQHFVMWIFLESIATRRHPEQVLTDHDFTDDISLLSDEIDQAQTLLSNVERECKKVGLGINHQCQEN